MGMCEERWSPEPSVVGEHSTHRHPPAESVDPQLGILSEEIIRQHTDQDCAYCRDDTCGILTWALGRQSGERQPYPT